MKVLIDFCNKIDLRCRNTHTPTTVVGQHARTNNAATWRNEDTGDQQIRTPIIHKMVATSHNTDSQAATEQPRFMTEHVSCLHTAISHHIRNSTTRAATVFGEDTENMNSKL